ncbi:MAG: ROK family transcriptional regulator [Lachnospiraceae bacterium]|nr:ROK family transcriptional regulator [Lachnospiraceae bacterium]
MGMSSIEVKKANQNSVLRYVLQQEEETKNSIAGALGLSIPTVTQCLKKLEDYGLVKETGSMQSIGGRKAIGYTCVKNAKAAIGVDITPNHVNIVVIDLAMQLLYSKRQNIRLYDDKASYDALRRVIEQALYESGVKKDSILGMGISLPTITDETGTRIFALHEKMQISFGFYDTVKDWFDFPVIMRNDANCAAQAEMNARGETGNAVYFFISQSVGGAIVNHGKINPGESLREGEFGHMTLIPGPTGRPCFCGRRGCADAYLTTSILADAADGLLDKFFQELPEKEAYRALWEEYLQYLALAIHNLNMVFDRPLIIGGYLGEYIGSYTEELGKKIREMDPYLEDSSFVKPAVLKYEAAAMGAAAVFTEQYLNSL